VPVADASLAVVAAAAAILSAGGSIAAAVVAWKLGIVRFKHERAQADREDARDVLAAGAFALGRAKATRRKAHAGFRKPLSDVSVFWPDDFGEQRLAGPGSDSLAARAPGRFRRQLRSLTLESAGEHKPVPVAS
jgi:hypothetical protein